MLTILRSTMLVVALVPVAAWCASSYTVEGTVLLPDGGPAADANVWINQARSPRATKTDAAGRFRFEGTPAGPVDVIAWAAGTAIGGVRGQIIDDADVTIVLGKPESIHLRIIDAQHRPVWGARLKRLDIDQAVTLHTEDLVPLGFPSVRSDEDGFMVIENVPRQGFTGVVVSHRDHADASLPAVPAGIEIDLQMPFGVKLRGRVTNESGEGISRTRVSVFRLVNGRETAFTEVLTGPEGFYTASAPPRRYFVAARHRDYAMPEPRGVMLKENADPPTVDFVLPAPHRIRGKAVDTEGAPVSMVKLSYKTDGVVYDETVSDVAGAFELVVSAGEGVLQVRPPKRMTTVLYPEIRFEVDEQPVIEIDPIELKALPEIRGRIVAADGTPLDKVVIASLNLNPPMWITTEADGAFTIELDRMPEETLQFRAEHALRFLRRDFQVDREQTRVGDIRLLTFRPELEVGDAAASNNLAHMVGKPAPEIECDAWFNLPGGEEALSLEQLRGKVVVLTLWGGFDTFGTTRHRLNEMNALYRVYGEDEGVVILSVHDASLEPSDIQQYVRAFDVRFPVGCDADPFLTFDLYNTNVIPQTILIDKQGILRYYQVDGRLLELIKDLRRR